jgi:hypothetical protein
MGSGNASSGAPRQAAGAVFYVALGLVCGCTLIYEVVLTRLLSVVAWYYLAFVSVSMGMFGMTLGSLLVQFRPAWFRNEDAPRRLRQGATALAVSLPLTLLNMLAVPLELSHSVQPAYTFLLFCVIVSVPFFFSGAVVCLALTRGLYPVGRAYAADLLGASSGCFFALFLLSWTDAPSAMLVTSGLVFVGAALFARVEGRADRRRQLLAAGLLALVAALANGRTLHGIQPMWVKGMLDPRNDIFAEAWSPISCVTARKPRIAPPAMWGPSPLTPPTSFEYVPITIDSDAGTGILRLPEDLSRLDYLRYDVTSLPAELRPGGEAAVIGVGGGRDVLNAAVVNRYRRVMGIEINGAILELALGRLGAFSKLGRLPGVSLHHDEGRSFLARTPHRFDLIQASMVDTWAATSAGAMTLSENALYTVEGWRTFYGRLKPGGVIGFSRWNVGPAASQTNRLVSVATATLLAEGVAAPADQLALVSCRGVSTLILSNRPLSPQDVELLRLRSRERRFDVLHLPGQPIADPVLARIIGARTIADLERLREEGPYDLSPTFDRSPFFFNSVRLRHLPGLASDLTYAGNLRALAFLMLFLLAAAILVAATILLPLVRAIRASRSSPSRGGAAFFVFIGMGFMMVEIGMMQRLSLLLGHPLYSLAVVLAGLLAATGLGALASARLAPDSRWSGWPAALAAVVTFAYSFAAEALVAANVSHGFARRVLLALALVAPCGFVMGLCAPVGIRRLERLGQGEWLPWMWGLNGAAAVLSTFVAIVLSMEASIPTSVRVGSAVYLLAALALPRRQGAAAGSPTTSTQGL